LNQWINKSVALNDAWGPGADHSLTTPLRVLPQFTMRLRCVRDHVGKSQPAHFSVDFSSGYLDDGWWGVNFVPMGSQAITSISNLPPWSAAQKDHYRTVIDAHANDFADSKAARLEGVVPYVAQGVVGYNKLMLFYLAKAVNGPDPDLVVVRVASHLTPAGKVQARQDGTGHGPPH